MYDYAPGKSDWTAAGLPTEGDLADEPRPGRLAKPTPTCSLDDRVGDVAARTDVRQVGFCVVTNDEGIIAGRLRTKHLDAGDGSRAEEVMENGPATVRYDESLVKLTARMAARNIDTILVSTPEGRLLGVMYRSDAEDLLRRLHEEHHHHKDA